MNIIYRIPLGIIPFATANAYLIKGRDGYVLVDAGNRHHAGRFAKKLHRLGIAPAQIKLIIITHVHFDHVGSLAAIKSLCRCPVAVHEAEVDILRKGKVVISAGTNYTGKVISCLGNKLAPIYVKLQPVEPEIIVSGEISLDSFGLSGKIIPTPGHTKGSITVLLPSGEAFTGDLAINHYPFYLGPIFPPFANDVPELFRSWKKLIAAGAKLVFPGHGRAFKVEKMLDLLRGDGWD